MANFDFAKTKPSLSKFVTKLFDPKTSRVFTFLSAVAVFLIIPVLAGVIQFVLNLVNKRDIFDPLNTAVEYSLYWFLLALIFLNLTFNLFYGKYKQGA